MRKFLGAVSVFPFVLPVVAWAQQPKVLESARPKWVLGVPEVVTSEPPKDALLQVRFFDNQVRVTPNGQENYISQRFKILRPEALQVANLTFVWRPVSGQLLVHTIKIHRADGTSEEMLGKAKFQTIQREENLEQSILTGLVTAVFAIPGVEVGDEVEFATTITNRDPTLGDQTFGLLQLPLVEIGGIYRLRVLQSEGAKLIRKVTPDLQALSAVKASTPDELVVELRNPKSANLPEGAPSRYAMGRLLEFSSFNDWQGISSTFWKHFDSASKLSPKSSIRSEIAKIAAASNDPEVRALAALKFVQDRIRYVYVGLGAGNYTPASAEETWLRRYGDCKGKTVLLLAMLRELGVPAEAALVNQSGLEDIANRLASPGLFDHVLVRATIGQKRVWLDGTQFSSPKFEYLAQPTFRAALPLRTSGAEIETVKADPLNSPNLLEVVDIDASAGVEKPAKKSVRRVFHGNEVSQLRTALASLAGDDLKRAITNVLAGGPDSETEAATWTFDDQTGALSMKWTGTQKLDWEGDKPSEYWYYLPSAGFTPPSELKRPKEQNQLAPWAVEYPMFKCWITTMRLPPDQGKVKWDYSAAPVDRTLGGVQYYRKATIQKGVVQTIMSRRTLQSELSTEEAEEVIKAMPKFNNDKSYVYRRVAKPSSGNEDDKKPVVDPASIDWKAGGELCQSAKKT